MTLPTVAAPAHPLQAESGQDSATLVAPTRSNSVVAPAVAPLGGATRPLDWRWVAALLFLWLGLVAMYELGAPQLANGFAILSALSAMFLLGPGAIAEINSLIGGS